MRTDSKNMSIHEFLAGTKQSIPIALGYFPVSFTFGLMAVKGGIPVWIVILGAMIFPDILSSTGNLSSAVAGLVIAVILAYFERSLLQVAVCAIIAVYVFELIIVH
ncbi:MAG: AzlD domain-containing protein [Ruminiclostridium sp.]